MADDVKLRVGLKDDASAGLTRLANQVRGLENAAKGGAGGAAAFGAGLGKVTPAMLALTGALVVGGIAINKISQGMQESLKEFSEYSNAMIGLTSVAGALGESQDLARESAKALAQDGLMTVGEAASGLKNLLGAGFGLEEANQLMLAFKDTAAFNRQGTLEFGQAIVGATQGIKNQNSVMVDNVGLTKNLSIIMKEAGLSVDDLGKVSSDAGVRQKFLNGLLRETGLFAGDAARLTDTLSGAQSRSNVSAKMLKSTLGSALAPAMTLLLEAVTMVSQGLNNSLTNSLNNVAKFFVRVAANAINFGNQIVLVGRQVMAIIQGIGQAGAALLSLNFKGVGSSLKEMGANMASNKKQANDFTVKVGQLYNKINTKIDTQGLSGFGNVFKDTMDKAAGAADDAGKKIRDSLEKENKEFQQKMAEMAKDFQENIKDLVIAHRDKANKLKKDLSDENNDFNKKMAERKADFDKGMKEIEERHGEKVATISKQITKEKDKIEEEIDKITDKYKDAMIQFQKAGEERLTSLQVQYDREKGEGQFADQEKLQSLQDMINRERMSLEEQLALKEDMIEKEKEKVIAEHDERLLELEEDLKKENTDFLKAQDERKAAYEAETAKIKEEHQKRVDSLQAELNAEMEIQKKHAEDFARFQDAVAEDDMTRLKRKYAEQRAEEEAQHQERLADIARRVQDERATASAGSVKGGGQNFGGAVSNLQNKSKQTAAKVQASGKSSTQAPSLAQRVGGIVATAVGTAIPGFGAVLGAVNLARNIFGFAEGGVVTKPTAGVFGEDGPEALIPLSKPSRARQVLADAGIETNKNITINMPVTVLNNELDLDVIVERLGFQLSRSGMI